MRSLTTMCLLMEKVSVLLETLKIMTLKSLQLKICQVAYIILFCFITVIMFSKSMITCFEYSSVLGNEYPAIVEFSSFQKVPKKKAKKPDSKKGTIEQGTVPYTMPWSICIVDGSENNTCTQYWDETYCQILSNNPGLTCFS